MDKIITIGEKGNEAKRKKFSVDDKGIKWEGQEMETPASTPLESDIGRGQEMTIRRFQIALPPRKSLPKGMTPPTDEEMLKHYKGQVLAMLWKDGWEQFGDFKTLRDKKEKFFYIFVPAKPLVGTRTQVLVERPMTLSEVLHGKNAGKRNTK